MRQPHAHGPAAALVCSLSCCTDIRMLTPAFAWYHRLTLWHTQSQAIHERRQLGASSSTRQHSAKSIQAGETPLMWRFAQHSQSSSLGRLFSPRAKPKTAMVRMLAVSLVHCSTSKTVSVCLVTCRCGPRCAFVLHAKLLLRRMDLKEDRQCHSETATTKIQPLSQRPGMGSSFNLVVTQ